MQTDKQLASTVEAPENVRALLSLVVDPEKVEVARSVIYTFHALVAKQWRDQHAFIAGDAAHQMPPFAGQGMCSGLRDVHNLSWKLALVLEGAASDTLLDTYAQERIPHVTRMTRGTMLLGNLIQTRQPIRAFLRDLLFKTILRIPKLFGKLAQFTLRSPALKQGVLGGEFPDARGTLFIQPLIQIMQTESQDTLLLDEVLGCGFAVLAMNQSSEPWGDHPNRNVGFKLPVTFIQVFDKDTAFQAASTDIKTIRDIEGALTAWFQKYNADFVIVRPDRYVFGAYTSAGFAGAIDELLAQLTINANEKII